MTKPKGWAEDPDFLTEEKLLEIIDFIATYYGVKSFTKQLMVPVAASPIEENELVVLDNINDGLNYVKPHASYDWVMLVIRVIKKLSYEEFSKIRLSGDIDDDFISITKAIKHIKTTPTWKKLSQQLEHS